MMISLPQQKKEHILEQCRSLPETQTVRHVSQGNWTASGSFPSSKIWEYVVQGSGKREDLCSKA